MHIYILPQCSTTAASVLNSAGMDAQFERSCCAISRGILRLRAITKRNRGVNVRKVMQEIKVYMTGWLNYYGIASLKTKMREWDEWLRHRIRAYIWKQWKKPKTKLKNLMKLGVPEYYAYMAANSCRGYWFTVNTGAVTRGITKERLTRAGFFELSPAYESIQTACIGRAVYRTVRTVR